MILAIISFKKYSFVPLLYTDHLGKSCANKIINQLPCNGRYSSSQRYDHGNWLEVVVEFVGKGIIILTSEMSRQLEKLPHGEVSVLRFLKVHVMKGEKYMPRPKQCSIYYGNGWSSSCFWTKDGWQTFCFPLSSEKKSFWIYSRYTQ